MSQTTDPTGTRRGRGGAPSIEDVAPLGSRRGYAGAITACVEMQAVDVTHEQLQQELDGTRLAVVSLLAVTSDEQFRAVEMALMAVTPMSEIAQAALEALRTARHERLADAKSRRGDQEPKTA